MNYSGINAKIRSMRGKLLKTQDYIDLANSKSIEDLANKLKNFETYEKIILELGHDELHRSNIESKLSFILMADFKRIFKFVDDYGLKKYLSAYFLKHEILILKLILSMIHDKRNLEYNLPEINFFIKIDFNKLKSSVSIKDFIDNLKGTEFYDILINTYTQTQSVFELEIKLDLYYYMRIWSLQKKYLSVKNKNILSVVMGTEIDLLNIIWLYRMKKYYKLEENKLYSYLIPVRYKLFKHEIANLVKSRDHNEFDCVLKKTFYGIEFKNKNSLEQIFYKNMIRIYNKFFMMAQNSVSSVIFYIYLKELEINNIFSLIESVRYKLNAQEILSYLCLKEA